MATIDINYADYVRGVRTSAQGAVLLTARLVASAPKDMNGEEKKALRLVETRSVEVTDVLGDRDRLAAPKLRPFLGPFSNDWAAIYNALLAKGRLPVHISPKGLEAQAICSSLFPDGVAFTQLDAGSAWVEGKRRIERIDAEGLGHRIEALVGDGYLDAVRKSTDALAIALGAGKEKRSFPSSTALSEALTRFGKAVGAYGRVLAARVDEDDDASVQRFVHAMSPLDLHRASVRGSSDTGSDAGGDAGDGGADPSAPATPPPTTGNASPAPGTSPTTTSNGTPSPTENAG